MPIFLDNIFSQLHIPAGHSYPTLSTTAASGDEWKYRRAPWLKTTMSWHHRTCWKHIGKHIYSTLLASRHPLIRKMRKEDKYTACRVKRETSIIFLRSSVMLNMFQPSAAHTAALHRVEKKKSHIWFMLQPLKIPDDSPVESNNRARLAVNGRYWQ